MNTSYIAQLIILLGLTFTQSAWAEGEDSDKAIWRAALVAQGISHPWGMAWLPDGRLLVTSRSGTLHRLNGDRFVNVPLDGLPNIFVDGQGGLLDIAVHPDDGEVPVRVYMTAALGNQLRNRTALLQGVFDGQRVGNIRVLFKVRPVKLGSQHFGSRLLWLPDRTLLMSVGDGGNPPLRIGDRLARDQAQNLAAHLGKILRLTDNGLPAPGNPYLNQNGVQPEIWTRGHRNIQGLALAPNGRVWATEHGPRGGDELNVIKGGRNYGWPLQSRGFDYNTGEPVGQPVVPGMKHPKTWWTPSIATSGLTVYSGPHFPRWQGNVFAGGLVSQDLRRLVVDENGKVLKEVRLPIGARVRDVRQGPDGFLYVLTDEENGKLYRIERQL